MTGYVNIVPEGSLSVSVSVCFCVYVCLCLCLSVGRSVETLVPKRLNKFKRNSGRMCKQEPEMAQILSLLLLFHELSDEKGIIDFRS